MSWNTDIRLRDCQSQKFRNKGRNKKEKSCTMHALWITFEHYEESVTFKLICTSACRKYHTNIFYILLYECKITEWNLLNTLNINGLFFKNFQVHSDCLWCILSTKWKVYGITSSCTRSKFFEGWIIVKNYFNKEQFLNLYEIFSFSIKKF